MSELEEILIGVKRGVVAGCHSGGPPRRGRSLGGCGAPHTIYQELWHIAFWQQVTLDWIDHIETPFPDHAAAGFPTETDAAREDWEALRRRFLAASGRPRRRRATRAGLIRRSAALPAGLAGPRHDRARATGEPRSAQRLPPRPRRPAAPASWLLAAALRWLQLVSRMRCASGSAVRVCERTAEKGIITLHDDAADN